MCLDIETPNNHHFPFGTNEEEVVLGVPTFKHFRVDRYLVTILYFDICSPPQPIETMKDSKNIDNQRRKTSGSHFVAVSNSFIMCNAAYQ